MKKIIIIAMVAVAAVATFGVIPDFHDDFDVNYADGHTFMAVTDMGWQASSPAATVTNRGGYTNSWAVVMAESVALTNTVNADPNLKVWTDFRIKPVLWIEDSTPPTNASSLLYYFNRDGRVVVALSNGWHVCTNDIWGNAVAPATNNAYVRLSVFQDYAAARQAVFLDGQLILQDLGLAGGVAAYSRLVIQNTDSNCWLDTVWVKTNFEAATLTNSLNGDGIADAGEVHTYGYARRTLYVSSAPTNLVPLYSSMTNAVAAWRPRDIIHVIAGDYSAEQVVIGGNPSNVVFEGAAFTVASLTVASNASASFVQSLSCGTLSLSGQVSVVNGGALTAATAHVVGSLSVTDGGAFDVATLDLSAPGVLHFTNAQLVANSGEVVMNGTFAISNTWGSASVVSMPLPFSDNFDLYAENTALTNLKCRGWNASDGRVKVQGAIAHADKAVVLPDSTVLSNSIDAAGITRIWTDCYIQPALGFEQPPAAMANQSSFLAYSDTNGYLVVAVAGGGWTVCSNQLDNTPATPLTNGFTRVTVCQDLGFSPPLFAVFVAGKLVAQGLSAPANISRYAAFVADNRDGTAYVDDVLITTAIPPGLTSDLNHNGLADAYEINTYGLTSEFLPRGSIYRFR